LNFGTQESDKGLSEVVSSLILLVVAVLLASVCTYYATNITRTRTNVEEVRFSKERVWVNGTGAVAAFKIQNVGGRDILVDSVRIRGVEAGWRDVYYYRVPSGTSVTGELNRTSYSSLTGTNITIDGRAYNRSDNVIPLVSSGSILFYIKGPGNIQTDDVGTTINLSLCTNNAQYITEVNVESATDQ
jgi:flagellin-like protein